MTEINYEKKYKKLEKAVKKFLGGYIWPNCEMAEDQGNDELANMIKNDLSAVKVRLQSGKDLGFVKGMQDKYSKFVKTEGLAYESRLAIMLDQRIK